MNLDDVRKKIKNKTASKEEVEFFREHVSGIVSRTKKPGKDSDKGYLEKGLEAIESRTGAPSRAALSAAIKGESPTKAFQEQYAEPSELAPTGKDIAEQVGIKREPLVTEEMQEQALMDAPMGTSPHLLQTMKEAEVTKSGTAGLAIDLAADWTNLVPEVAVSKAVKTLTKATGTAFKRASSMKAFKALMQIADASKIKRSHPEVVGQVLMDTKLGKHLNNPQKILNELTGKSKLINTNPEVDAFEIYTQYNSPGIIGNTSKILGRKIKWLSNNGAHPVSLLRISKAYTKRLLDAGKKSGIMPTQEKVLKVQEMLRGLFKSEKVSLQEAQEIKQTIGRQLSNADFSAAAAADKELRLEKEVLTEMYHELKQAIMDSASGIPVKVGRKTIDGGKYIEGQNQRIAAMLEIAESVKDTSYKMATGQGAAQKALTTGGTAAVSGALAYKYGFDPLYGILAGGGVAKGVQELAGKYPAAAAKLLRGASAVPEMARKAAMISPAISKLPIAEQLIRTPLPRTSDAILQNKKFVLAKVAQQMPMMFDMVQEAIEHRPEQMPEILPFLIKQFPEFFEPARYNEVDGRVTDPIDKQRYTQDTMRRDDLTNTQKILALDKLNKTGEIA